MVTGIIVTLLKEGKLLRMENNLQKLKKFGFNSVENLEEYFKFVNDCADRGNPVISDAEWDSLRNLLEEVNPDSELLNMNWSTDEGELTSNDKLLDEYGMCSITTLKEISMRELETFAKVIDSAGGVVTVHGAIKENGHAIRAVYKNGRLQSGSTRGRYKKGRDITRHLQMRIPNYIEAFEKYNLVEIRGEALVTVRDFENKIKDVYGLKTPLSSVTSFLRESATDTEIEMLDFVMYKVLIDDDNKPFKTLYDEYELLKNLGFKIPQHERLDGVTRDNLVHAVNSFLKYFEGFMDRGEIPYACDGLVLAVDDDETFYNGGKHGNAWNANFAVKEGRYWKNNIYSSTIENIVWQPGKKYLVPKAIITPVICSNGAQVENVPLYNVGVMERYGYTVGETVYFRFGGETGVTLCDYLGQSCKK